MDCGPADKANYFSDDFDAPQYPFGHFLVETQNTDLRKQAKGTYPNVPDVSPDSALCPRMMITVQGFSVADDDGDDNKTPGVPHFLLIDHTVDPTGENGRARWGSEPSVRSRAARPTSRAATRPSTSSATS